MELKLIGCCPNYPSLIRKELIKSFQKSLTWPPKKFGSHLDKHPAYAYDRAVLVFDPRQLAVVGHDITDFDVISGLEHPSAELHEEWLLYMQLPPGLEHPSAELHEEWLIYMQLPPGLEHPSAELHKEWLIYMQLPPGLEHPSAQELHEEWLIYAITTRS